MSQSFTTETFCHSCPIELIVSHGGGVYICNMNDSMQICETNGSHSEFLSPAVKSSMRVFTVHGLAVMVAYGKPMDLILNFLSMHPGPDREHFQLVMVA